MLLHLYTSTLFGRGGYWVALAYNIYKTKLLKRVKIKPKVYSSSKVQEKEISQLLSTDAVNEMVVKRQEDSFRGVRLDVGRTLRVKHRVC